ncbi:Mitogen-activated protein kinase kinase kinase YODA [Cytospora mali]|uniref:Mitogen-activated protein kinase kinase kinase YODA n=1 Tax=Cytospora mali TaxID=578113 RepID=A0A194VIH9_CYTMA|nr:Mitogen-activated protein kinase kinase kinase YODA [Valsa mali]
MFYDRSHSQTCQVYGENASPFEYARPSRKVVVLRTNNTIIGMGGVARDLFKFELIWHDEDPDDTQKINIGDAATLDGNPRLAQTVDETSTVLPSHQTRIHTPGLQQLRMRYQQIGTRIGTGQYGVVDKAIDLDSGKLMAVKTLRSTENQSAKLSQQTKREVENLSRISFPYIIDYLGSQDWDTPNPQIFMGLKDGSLEKLVRNGSYFSADDVFHHTLQALDYLATQDIVHRDVKPENILYVLGPDNKHQFQLGDFGFSNHVSMAQTFAGTPMFMAPEMLRGGSGTGYQTHKVDIWSLYVTMVWTLNINRFREEADNFTSVVQCQDAILLIASKVERLNFMAPMVRMDPENRASAAQMLVKAFGGNGLSTPRNMVRPLIADTAKAIGETPAVVIPTTTTRRPIRRIRSTKHMDMPANPFRVNKNKRYPPGRRPLKE